MAVDMGTAKGYLDLDTSKFKTGLRSALDDLKTFQSEGATTKDKISSFGSAATSAGKSLTKGLTAPIVGLGAASVAVTGKFEAGMSKVQAVSGATGDEMKLLSDKAKEMGANTKFSATQSAEAFNYMAMAGWKTEDMLNGIEGVMNLAAASGEDLATTSDIVTDALTAFGLSAEDSTHFADVLAAASSNANTNVAMMGETFKYVAPVAGALGFNVEDVSTAIGLMANSGIKGSQAGTALRNIFTRMVKPTKESAEVMEKLGITVTDSQGNMKDLDTIMGDLRKGFSGLSESEKSAAASALAGQYGMSGLLAIVNSSDKDFNKLSKAINNADGASAEMAETMMDNLPGAITLAKSALEGLGIRVGEVITPAVTKVVQVFTKFVSWLSQASDGVVAFAVGLGVLLASIGPVLFALGTMANKIVSLITLYEKMSTVLKGKAVGSFLASAKAKMVDTAASVKNAAANIFNSKAMTAMGASAKGAVAKVLALAMAHKVATGAIFGIIGILAGVAIYMHKTGTSASEMKDKIVNVFNNVVEQLPQIMSTVAQVASGIAKQIPALVRSALSSLGEVIKTGLDNLKTALPEIAQWWANDMPQMIAVGGDMIVNIINGFSQMLPQLIATGTDMVIQLINQFFAQAPQFINVGMQVVLSLIQGITQALPQLVASFSQLLSSNLGPIINQVIKVMISIANAIIQNLPLILTAAGQIVIAIVQALAQNAPTIIQGAFKLVVALVTGIIQALPQLALAAGKIIIALIEALLSFTGSMLSAGGRLIMALIQGLMGWGASLGTKGRELGRKALQGIRGGLGNLMGVGAQWLQGLWRGIKSKTSSVVSGAKAWAKGLPKAIKGALGSLTSAGRDLIKGLWNGMKDKFDGAIDWAKRKAANLPKAIKKILGIGSPSWIMHEYGEWFMEGLQNGITEGYKPLMRSLHKQMNSILDVYTSMSDYDFGIAPTADARLLEAIGGLSVPASQASGGNMININNTIDGSENPEDFAERMTRQLKISMRTV